MPPKEATFKPFVVAYGANNFRLDRDVEKLATGKRRVIKLDGEGLSDAALIDHCEAYDEAPRTIIVDNAQEMKIGKDLQPFLEGRDVRDLSLKLAVIIRSPKLPEVWESVGSKGDILQRENLKPWDKDGFTKFVVGEATVHRAAISKDVADMLFEWVGPDFYRLANEVKKLATYVGQAGTIKKEHILLVTTRTPQATPFQVAEAVLEKNPTKAMNLFSVLYGNSGEAKTLIPVLYELMKQVSTAATIRGMQEQGMSEEDTASMLSMNPWKYKNHVAPMVKKHSTKALVGYMGQLCRLDAYVKSGAISKRTMVELTMLSIAE
jgi:DNA polymerase-3 subunit delta